MDEEEEDVDRMTQVNVKGVWSRCMAAIDSFVRNGVAGQIVSIASVGGTVGILNERARWRPPQERS